MSDQPFPALHRAMAYVAKGRGGAAVKAFDTAEARIGERVVKIYADGRLAYRGYLSLAAIRLDISARALTLSIDRGLAIAHPRQPSFYQTPDG